ncbi:hypothetical protein PHYBOEH_001845 [Phytophthora boehmeriae]|uniref:Major facilitator superfamily (MFS) profile domain-containing protein n=1 Tax=Phytophthora boehmeriae TaxID=109152 RepID=A0A8T1V6W2_9STRA|nr:hypothetical protein PHYBOEH_001845 [Phytophthora boehmeriae]
MIGSLLCGQFSNKYGRKRLMMTNCLFMIAGAVLQASALSIKMFIGGRVVSGIASGGATGVIPGFISEISPPTLRSSLGVGFQIAITLGNFLVAVTFFFADTSSGWRYIAGFPIVLGTLFLILAPIVIVESPAWLLMMGKTQQAERELARLFGQENVYLAKTWMKQENAAGSISACDYIVPATPTTQELDARKPSNLASLFSPKLIRQTLTAIGMAGAQQLTGINAVFFYSSTLFEQAGIADDRIGIVAVNFINVLPTMFCGLLAMRLGNRRLILYGLTGMLFSAVGITASLVANLPTLAIVFTALGSLSWVVMSSLFPDEVRAIGNSLCAGCCWMFNLTVGLGYPYISAALANFRFTPFVFTVSLSFVFVYSLVPDSASSNVVNKAGSESLS